MARELKAKDVMHPKVITVKPDIDVWSLARLFTETGITGAPVVDDADAVIGVVSQTDIVRHLREVIAQDSFREDDFYSDSEHFEPASSGKVLTARDLMSPNVIQADEDTPVGELSRKMLSLKIHRVIITDGRQLKGVVTTMDLLKVL